MVGFANISARGMLDHLFGTCSNITTVDFEINFEHMQRAWDPQQPVESLFKQIQGCDYYFEAEGVLIGHAHKINVGYAKNICNWEVHERLSPVERKNTC
jgi:hypothetical protein